MAIKLPDRNYLTFPELMQHWQCTETDLRRVILDEQLKPSYVINHVATKVKFYQETVDGNTYWVPDPAVMTEDGRGKLFETYGFYYLLHPHRQSALECTFRLFSRDRNHVEGDADENVCFWLGGQHARWGRGLSLTEVLATGVVMRTEVALFEAGLAGDAATSAPQQNFSRREQENLLRLVLAMAVDGYGYKPGEAKSSSPKELADAMAGLGFSLTDETIRGYLRAAVRLLPAKPPPR